MAALTPDPSDDLAASVAGVKGELRDAMAKGSLENDPIRYVFGALAALLDVLVMAVRAVWKAATAGQGILSAEERAGLVRSVQADVETAAQAAMGRAVAGLARAANRRTAALAGAAVALAGLVCGIVGYTAGRVAGERDVAALEAGLTLPLEDARALVAFIRANPDVTRVLKPAETWVDPQTKARAGRLLVWLERPTISGPAGR